MSDGMGSDERVVQLRDGSGRVLGRVVGAAAAPLVGRGAATVLLQRLPPVRAAPPPPAELPS
jgi:hypothetical protein